MDIKDFLCKLGEHYYEDWKCTYQTDFRTDSSWGEYLNIVRQRIIAFQKECEREYGLTFMNYPESYWYPLPQVLTDSFITATQQTKSFPTYEEMVKFDWSEV